MSVAAPEATVVPSAPPAAPAAGVVAAPEASSGMGGAQSVRPAPSGTIPAPLRAYSERPDSAKSKMLERLKAKAAPEAKPPAEAAKPVETPIAPEAAEAPAEEAPPEAAESDDDLLDDGKALGKSKVPAEEAKPGETPADPKAVKPKVNPWKLVEEHKTRAAKLEQEVAELKKVSPNTETLKAQQAEFEAVKKRAQELEEHIKLVDYQASDEYKEKYEKPYEHQWITAMKELKGVTIVDDSGEARDIDPSDLLKLVNMPLAEARKAANETFGDFANDVMDHRAEIRKLYEARQEALTNAKKEGVQRIDQFQKMSQEKMAAVNTEVRQTYEKAVKTFENDPKMAEFFKPIEGDDDANAMLEKGYAMVEKAFASNPMDPNLTPEQRASIVKMHAAVRHRSAAFGRVRHLLAKERAAHQATLKKLQQYESTVPNRGGGVAPANATASGSKMEQMMAKLRARAK